MTPNRICVFTGSSPGARATYAETARAFGRRLVERGHEVVYGAGNIGLMGELADSVLEAGGRIIGVIPEGLVRREVAHNGLSELHVVESMHERKALMAELADAFVALPGGLGTLEELLETVTWAQLGLHGKPCGVLNVGDFFTGLTRFLDHAVEERFIKPEHRAMLIVDDEMDRLLDRLATYSPPETEKWLDRAQT